MKTLRCIYTDLKRVLTCPYFFAGTAIMAAVCFTQSAYTDYSNGKSYNVIEAFFQLRDKGIFGLTAEQLCCKSVSGYALMFMGVIAAFPFIFVSCGEQKSGLRFSICREGTINYALSKTVSALVSAGLVCGLGQLLYSGAVFMMFPSGEFYPPEEGLSFAGALLKFVLGTTLSGMSAAVLPLFISAFTSNKYFCVCVPFLADYLRTTVSHKLIMGIGMSDSAQERYDLISLICPDYMIWTVWSYYSKTALALCVFACSALAAFAAVALARKGRVDIGE